MSAGAREGTRPFGEVGASPEDVASLYGSPVEAVVNKVIDRGRRVHEQPHLE